VVDEVRALFEGVWGTPPGTVDPGVRRAVALMADPDSSELPVPALNEIRAQAEGLASSEEELLLLGLFGDEAEPLLEAIRGRSTGESIESGVDRVRAERIREVVRIVQETGVGEVTVDEGGMRISVRRTQEPGEPLPPAEQTETLGSATPLASPNGLVQVESPMVGVFYRSPEPGKPSFVELGDVVTVGQTLCLLEAMKLFNELKAESSGIVREIHVDNAQPVEFGQLLFELEPVGASAPLDAV
jgi:oxaloacetate decarboxylase alpha subunit